MDKIIILILLIMNCQFSLARNTSKLSSGDLTSKDYTDCLFAHYEENNKETITNCNFVIIQDNLINAMNSCSATFDPSKIEENKLIDFKMNATKALNSKLDSIQKKCEFTLDYGYDPLTYSLLSNKFEQFRQKCESAKQKLATLSAERSNSKMKILIDSKMEFEKQNKNAYCEQEGQTRSSAWGSNQKRSDGVGGGRK